MIDSMVALLGDFFAVKRTNDRPEATTGTDVGRCDVVSQTAITFLGKYPESSNSDCWDHVTHMGRSHPLFQRTAEKFVIFQPRFGATPKTLTRHQFAKRMHFIRRRVRSDAKLDGSQT